MALVRYTPRSNFTSWPDVGLFSNRLSRVLGDVWDTTAPTGVWIPAVNVEEAADELLLTAELPGMREEDINVDIESNILTIRGEKREAREEADEERRYHVRERLHGRFHRRFTLPWSVESEAIQAGFDAGVLTVRLPKAPEAKSRAIEIGSGQ
jgi:HSP20 family protein